ncbi:hypothetical protein G6F31_011333 [Rhizopus arrhizus]|nr:hypothetical protein G6F31_011333 [Rhizopus arrhizus]
MTGDSIVRLVAGMEHNADVGLIQTLPSVIGGRTLFARMQQFGGRVYGPVIARGVAWWHGAESNYWGHNAIIRTRAFADHAGLPALPGRKPFGGHVLSHDFVEAALMRRGGWAAHMVPYLGGSYEEGPPTLTDLLVRDRRWCQGNLQHGKVVGSRGLHWISRTHMLIGIGHYFTAPMWAMLMLIGIAIPLFQQGIDFNALLHLSPSVYWRAQDEEQVVRLFAATMAVLLLPKVLGYLAMLLDPVDRRGCGGAIRAFVSMLVETVLAALMAPVVMYVQSRGVAEVLSGRDSGWDAQQRDDGGISWLALIRGYGGLGVFGAFMGVLAWAVSPSLAAWMAPVVIGMVLAVPVVALTSSRGPGAFLHRLGLLDIPEENIPPPVLVRAAQLRREAAEQPPLSRIMRHTVEQETGASPQWSVIWLHGLGADGHDFAPIVPELVRPHWPALRFVFPHAPVRPITINNGVPMRGWYDIVGMDFRSRADMAGVQESVVQLDALIAREIERGIAPEKIFLAGFSQGGAIILTAALSRTAPLAGLIALSTYLPEAESAKRVDGAVQVPVFMAHGSSDPVIPQAVAVHSAQALQALGLELEWHSYPMAHQVCAEEIQALGDWLQERLGAA